MGLADVVPMPVDTTPIEVTDPPCREARLNPVWRERGAVFSDGKITEASEGPFMWVGLCACGVASQAHTPEDAQEAIAEACALTRHFKRIEGVGD